MWLELVLKYEVNKIDVDHVFFTMNGEQSLIDHF